MAEQLTKVKRNLRGDQPANRRNAAKQKKGKNKKKGRKKALPPIRRGEPAYLYVCECHDERATKTPCERKPEDRAEGKFSESALGKWICSVTKKRCKVQRRKNKQETLPVIEIKDCGVTVTGEVTVQL